MTPIFKTGNIAIDLSLLAYVKKHEKAFDKDFTRLEFYLKNTSDINFVSLPVPDDKLETMFQTVCRAWETVKQREV